MSSFINVVRFCECQRARDLFRRYECDQEIGFPDRCNTDGQFHVWATIRAEVVQG